MAEFVNQHKVDAQKNTFPTSWWHANKPLKKNSNGYIILQCCAMAIIALRPLGEHDLMHNHSKN
jgi:hypothetical protein